MKSHADAVRPVEPWTLFTGIIESTGTVVASDAVAGGRRLRVELSGATAAGQAGESLCIDGVCLTVTEIAGPVVAFDVITETLERTTLGTKRVGERVNVERSLRVGDRLDGHFVQGHVDGTARIARSSGGPKDRVVWLVPQSHLRPYLIPKGSVAMDGVSLTIAGLSGESFSVALIPTTLDRTTLASKKAGDVVNIESDVIARTIVHRLTEMQDAGGLSLEAIQKAGFA